MEEHPRKALFMKLMLEKRPVINFSAGVIKASASSHDILHGPGMALLPGMDTYWESQDRGNNVEEWLEYEFMAPIQVTSIWLITDKDHSPSAPYRNIEVKRKGHNNWEVLNLLPPAHIRWYTYNSDGSFAMRLDTDKTVPSDAIYLRWRMPYHSSHVRIYTMQIYGRPTEANHYFSHLEG